MKTDRFTDIIRRKLESIRPEFSEKDWTRMQASLQTGIPQPGSPTTGQPFSGGMWAAKPWLMAAATISTVVLVTFSFWQRREINNLRQTISQLNKHPTHQTSLGQPDLVASKTNAPELTRSQGVRPQTGQQPTASSENYAALPRQRDTIYITRNVAVPSRSQSVRPEEERVIERSEKTTEQRYATTDRPSASKIQPDQSENSTTYNSKTDAYGAPSTPSSVVNKEANNSSIATTKSVRQLARQRGSKGEYIAGREIKNKQAVPTNSVNIPTTNAITATTPTQPESVNEKDETSTSANYELVNSLPMSTPTINWTVRLAQRAKNIRPVRAVAVEPVLAAAVVEKAAPASQPINQKATRFRAGVGGEVASHVLSAGVFTEILIGKHVTVGVGLNQAAYNGIFINDYDFDVRTRRDFRKEFAHSIDPRRDILNINTQTVRLQIPVSFGYRIPLTQTLSLLPTIGTSLNIRSSENVTYYCPVFMPQKRGFDEFIVPNNDRPFALINSFALGAGIEWQHRHWVVQTSPVLTLPMQSENDPNWQNHTTLGLRARVLYQF
ncbi:hypothetical protein [Spirosoma flavum]|uniref:Outer membrane protein beta-barrel domain-containing protein n=1 Tax=Spirosoma flavum TaxID=2048557 RepID=A0ABW6AIX6_9BACT